MNIFERASRKRLTFDTSRGLLNTEDLWDLPLTGAGSLDETARAVNTQLQGFKTDSFVEQTPNTMAVACELRLDLLKHVIASKLSDRDAAKTRAENDERRKRLLNAKGSAEDAKLAAMSPEEIDAELAKLA